jgi:hypothetical protein
MAAYRLSHRPTNTRTVTLSNLYRACVSIIPSFNSLDPFHTDAVFSLSVQDNNISLLEQQKIPLRMPAGIDPKTILK